MPQQLYAPLEVDKGFGRRVVNRMTGNAYSLDGQGGATVQDADVAWFLTQGFAAVAAQMMFSPLDVSKAANRPVRSLATGTTYHLNSRGAAVIAAADVAWFAAQGFLATGQ